MVDITGTEGSDSRIGSDDADNMYGLGGNDQLDGRGGNDFIDGGSGNDILTGGLGTDTLQGGLGADIFRDTMAGLNGDHLLDLRIGDRLQITDLTTPNFAITGNTITYGSGDSVTVDGLGPGRLILRSLGATGYELRLQSAAHNDFNGDGRSDILWRNDDGTLTDWLGNANGNGGFTDNWNNAVASASTDWHVVGTGDFNGDGKVDLLWRNDDGTIADWLGADNGGFIRNYANSVKSVSNDWTVAATGDFNADGHSDILWRNTDGTIVNWLGNSSGGFDSNYTNSVASVPTNWQVLGTGDFNGDGRDDILWRSTDGVVTDWLATESGGYVDNFANAGRSVPTSWTMVGIGDFNGDGLSDLLWRGTDGTLTDWLGTGSGGFSSNWNQFVTVVPTNWSIAATGDYNGDGIDDILWRSTDGTVTDWLGTSTGSFVDNWAHAAGGAPTAWHVAADPFHA